MFFPGNTIVQISRVNFSLKTNIKQPLSSVDIADVTSSVLFSHHGPNGHLGGLVGKEVRDLFLDFSQK